MDSLIAFEEDRRCSNSKKCSQTARPRYRSPVGNRNSSVGFCCHGPQVMVRSAPFNVLPGEMNWASNGIAEAHRISRMRRKGAKNFMPRNDLVLHLLKWIKAV